MLFWKSLCGTVLIVMVSPDFFEKASIIAAMARFGTSSDSRGAEAGGLGGRGTTASGRCRGARAT